MNYFSRNFKFYFKVGDCRLRCLLALIPLFQTTDLVGKLELFTNRFKVIKEELL
jgi:hypothetical protein